MASATDITEILLKVALNTIKQTNKNIGSGTGMGRNLDCHR
jgi:hypothetical protein